MHIVLKIYHLNGQSDIDYRFIFYPKWELFMILFFN